MDVKQRPLLYIETSVFGFYFDPEPRNAERREAVTKMFEQVRRGILDAATSPLTFTELDRTAEPRRSELINLLSSVRRVSADRDEVGRLATVYLRERVIPNGLPKTPSTSPMRLCARLTFWYHSTYDI